MTSKTQRTTPRRSAVQARPRSRRSLLGYVRNGKIPALALMAGAGWLLYASLTSPRYVVHQVQLEGGQALTQSDVQTLAAVQDQPIWQIRARDVEARVEQSPYVERADVQVLLPATVVVRVRERQPAMRWQHNGVTYDVAQDGRILAAVTPSPVPGDPAATEALTGTETLSPTVPLSPVPGAGDASSVVVEDTTPNRALQPGDRIDPDALEVARRVALRAGELPASLDRIMWQQDLGIVLQVNGRTVIIGDSERLDEKMGILVHVLDEGTPFALLDLRPTAPYLRQ